MNNVIDRIVNEGRRLETDALYSYKGHFNAADNLDCWHYKLGISAAIGSVLASAALFAKLGGAWLYVGAVCGLLAAVIGGVSTFIDANKKANLHREAAGHYKYLRDRARVLCEIKCVAGLSESDLIIELENLQNDSADFSKTYPVIPKKAYEKAKAGIELGEANY